MEQIPLNVQKNEQPNKKSPEEIKATAARLFMLLGGKGILDRWGDAIGEPNPDMKEYLPHKRTKREKEETRSEPPPPKSILTSEQVEAEIKQTFNSWKSDFREFGEDGAIRVWEEMTDHLLSRGRTELRHVILESLYGLKN
ncbi:MAG: hypothetical protein PHC70_01425 [Patescibacteria group bacterium]|jgi:hypothetical protein|nr:hypothetical protein [Patescibacteria group bacterium]